MEENKTKAATDAKNEKSMEELLFARLQEDCPFMEIAGTVSMGEYKKADGTRVEYVELTMDSPFPDDPDLPTFVLVPKWRSDQSIFKYRAKKGLKTAEKGPFRAVISPYQYWNRKYKKDVLYIAIFAIDPFAPGRTIELQVKDEGDRTLLSVLFRDYWKLTHVDVEETEEYVND